MLQGRSIKERPVQLSWNTNNNFPEFPGIGEKKMLPYDFYLGKSKIQRFMFWVGIVSAIFLLLFFAHGVYGIATAGEPGIPLVTAAFAGESTGMRDIAVGELQKLLIPIATSLIAWVTMYGISWAKSGVETFLQKRNMKRSQRVLNVLSQAVNFVTENSGVEAAKAAAKAINPGASISGTPAAQEAMRQAITKTREIAAEENLTKFLPPNDANLELMLKGVLEGHKKGEYNMPPPFTKAAALAPLPIQGWVPSGSTPAGGSAG